MTKLLKLLLVISFSFMGQVQANERPVEPVSITIPYMDVASNHRLYADSLLKLALELSQEKFGPYELKQHESQTVIRRQLKELEQNRLSVAVSMPMPEWQAKALRVPFPIMKGLASYRMFFTLKQYLPGIQQAVNSQQWHQLYFGQGQGWSTAAILEHNGFKVVYGGGYETLFPMLQANRFQLLMRGVYEIDSEYPAFLQKIPELAIADQLAFFTYLPMYFYVSPSQPELASRIEYGLKLAAQNGQLDNLFEHFFQRAVGLMQSSPRLLQRLVNPNIDSSFFEDDRPFLLDEVVRFQTEENHTAQE